jgi:hypothetical protein
MSKRSEWGITAIFVIALASSSIVASAEQVTPTRIPRNAIINPRGEVLAPGYGAGVGVIIAAPGGAGGPPGGGPGTAQLTIEADNPVLDPGPNQDDIQKNLVVLSKFTKYDLFKTYFVAIPEDWTLVFAAKNVLASLAPVPAAATPVSGKIDIWHLADAGGHQSDGEVTAIWERQLVTAAPNNAFVLQGDGVEHSPDNAYFFRLEGFTADVPFNAYQMAVADFTNGLVTRLFLGEVAQAAGISGSRIKTLIDFPPPNMAAFNKNTFDSLAPTVWVFNAGITDVVDKTLRNTPFHSEAILYVWYAGQLLEDSNPAYIKATWSLLKYRYSYTLLGQSIGYTLNYLEGYRRGQLYKSLVLAGVSPDQFLASLDHCMAYLLREPMDPCSFNPQFSGPALINETFFNMLLTIFNVIAADTQMQEGNKASELKVLSSLMIGFNQGSLRAAAVSYGDLFSVGYSVGYSLGYDAGSRDGYVRGYSDGVRDGLAAAPKFDLGGLGQLFTEIGGIVTVVQKAIPVVEEVISWF